MHFNKALRHTIIWKAVNTAVLFFVNLLLVRLMGAEASGTFYYDVTLLGLLVLLQGFSLESGAIFYGSKSIEERQVMGAGLFAWLLLQAVLAIVILTFIDFTVATPAAFLFIISNITITYVGALFASAKVFLTPNIITAGVNFLLLITLCVLHLWRPGFIKPSDYLQPQLCYIYSFALQAILLTLAYFSKNQRAFRLKAGDHILLKKLFTFSVVAFASNLLFFLLTRVDYYFVAKYCSAVAMGNYIQVSKIGQILIVIPSIIAAVLLPYTASSAETLYLEKVQYFCRLITGVFIIITAAVAATGFWLLPLLFGDGFDMMYMALLCYMPGFFALSITTVLASYTGGRGWIAANLTATALSLAVVIAADIFLIPVCGINGAAIASTLAYFVCMIYLLVRVEKGAYFVLTDFFGLKLSDIKKLTSYNK